jgi:hypothetical protein
MAGQLNPSKPRLTPAELILLARQNASVARIARDGNCPGIARRAARAAVYYRDRAGAIARASRAERRRVA